MRERYEKRIQTLEKADKRNNDLINDKEITYYFFILFD